MAIKADYHLHSSYSGDSVEPMENMILSAIDRGLTHICFTEHMDMDYPITPDAPADTFLLQTDPYLYDLAGFKEKYAGKIRISFGVELGMQPHLMRQLALYSRSHEFDFIIGSTHVVQGQDPYYPEYFAGRSEEEAFRAYFNEVLANLKKCSCYDVCGHLDYVVRYGAAKDQHYSYEKYKDLLDAILLLLLEQEKGIELNTGGLRAGTRDASPCMEVLKRYRKLGGDVITVGSDAHDAGAVASHFAQAEEILTACGFRYYCVFENRLPEYFRL